MPVRPHILKAITRAALLGVLALWAAGHAQAETVVALPGAECKEVRATLELYVPIAPAFRQLQMPFPENAEKIEGTLCRLVAVGTGVHVENERVRTLKDMQRYVKGALLEAGWQETEQTERFKGRSKHGRDVFALTRNNAICVTTIQVGMVPGIDAPRAAMEDGTVYLGSLKPHQREWWIAVDCFHF
ncbi:MAG: hypothetical protein JJ900_09860 [Rhodospirillales bacterium]|nr:hypothetical protein [Rhodospirillales bacterium]MBO6787144.1 hypothetical protein [Rhodospirillales bacterium]